MTSAIARPALVDIARAVVGEVAPGELATFDDVSRDYLADPVRFRRGQDDTSGCLGSGFGAVVDLLAPDVLDAVRGVLVDAAVQPLVVGLASALWQGLRRIFRRTAAPAGGESVATDEQREQVRRALGPVLAAFALDDVQRQALLAALVDRLAGRISGQDLVP